MGSRKRLALDINRDSSERSPEQEDKLKAIAQAAARAVGSEVRTLITPKTAALAGPSSAQGEFKAPPPKFPARLAAQPAAEPAVVVAGAESPTAGSNPLASLLGYGADDEDQPPSPAAPRPANGAEQPPQPQQQPGEANTGTDVRDSLGATAGGGEEGSKDLDAELANFLSELETSGLLKDGSESGAAPEAAVQPAAVPEGGPGSAPAAAGPVEPGAAPQVLTTGEAGQPQLGGAEQGTGRAGAEGDTMDGVAGEEGEGGAAEQRVLGDVPGAEGWCRVVDMGSGSVYFWHQETNEVAWEPPPGAQVNVNGEPLALATGGEDAAMAEAGPVDGIDGAADGAGIAAAEEPQQQAVLAAETTATSPPRPASGNGRGSAELQRAGSSGEAAGSGSSSEEEEEEEEEEGQIVQAEQREHSGPVALPAGLLAAPSEEAMAAAGAVAQRCTEAAGSWLSSVPQVVRLAIEAQSLYTLLSLFGQQQAAAAQAGAPGSALTWASMESALGQALAALDAQLPGALQAAHQLAAGMAQQAQQQQQQGGEAGPWDPAGGRRSATGSGDGGEEEGGPPPLPPEPQDGGGGAAAEGGAGLAQLPSSNAAPAEQGAGAAATLQSSHEVSAGQEGLPPPLPPSEPPMDMDMDMEEEPLAPTKILPAGTAGRAALGLEGYWAGSGSDEEEGELPSEEKARPPLPQEPAPVPAAGSASTAGKAAAAGSAAAAAAAGLPPLPPSSAGYPYPPLPYGAYPPPPLPPLPLPPLPPLPFHPLFLPPLGLYPPPPYPYGPFVPAAPHAVAPGVGHATSVEPPPVPPEAAGELPLPAEPLAAAPVPERRREYSAQAQVNAVAAAKAPLEQPPLPSGAAPEAAAAPPLPAAASALGAGAGSAASEEGLARKRKQDRAAAGVAAVVTGGGGRKAKAAKLDKGTVSLINKWQAVQKQVAKLEAAEEAAAALDADPEAKAAAEEARRAREAEEWRLQQLRAGAVGENANFAPLVGDWRERLKAKAATEAKPKKKKAKAAAAAAAGGSGPDLAALSEGLPEGWAAMYDKASQQVYYGNLATKVGAGWGNNMLLVKLGQEV